jgi:hypothetical protein
MRIPLVASAALLCACATQPASAPDAHHARRSSGGDVLAAPSTDRRTSKPSKTAVELRLAQRKLWSEHVVWTRQYVIAAVAGTSDAGAVAKRLMRNQEELGAAIVPYYGEEAGARLTELLKEHIQIATEVVAAAKSGDKAKLGSADARWRRNAQDIAGFLADANPYWGRDMLVSMMNEHLDLTTAEAGARIKGEWEVDIAAFDKTHEQALSMADMLADGILRQFPPRD